MHVRVQGVGGGVWLPDGVGLDLVRGDRDELKVAVWRRGGRPTLEKEYQFEGTIYRPGALPSSLIQKIVFPRGVSDSCSPAELFQDFENEFTQRLGLQGRNAELLASFVLATWVGDLLDIAPTVSFFGPSQNPSWELLQLLACLCRRGLVLGDLTLSGLARLRIDQLQPTLLIHAPAAPSRLRRILAASSRRVSVLGQGSLHDLSCAKAIFCGPQPYSELAEVGVAIPLGQISGHLPIMSREMKQEIAERFQPRLLRFRFEQHDAICAARRGGARSVLGGVAASFSLPLEGDPQLQSRVTARVQEVLERQREEEQPEVVAVIDALLSLCHDRQDSFYVGELAKIANVVLQGRGETLHLNPRRVGALVATFGIETVRMGAAGRGVRLSSKARQVIHDLAVNHGVSTKGPGCVLCSQRMPPKRA